MSDKLEFLSFSTSLCKGTEEYFLKCINLHVVVPNSFSLLREHDMGSHIQFLGIVNKNLLKP